MVHDVEELAFELQFEPLGDGERLVDTQVRTPHTRRAERVTGRHVARERAPVDRTFTHAADPPLTRARNRVDVVEVLPHVEGEVVPSVEAGAVARAVRVKPVGRRSFRSGNVMP